MSKRLFVIIGILAGAATLSACGAGDDPASTLSEIRVQRFDDVTARTWVDAAGLHSRISAADDRVIAKLDRAAPGALTTWTVAERSAGFLTSAVTVDDAATRLYALVRATNATGTRLLAQIGGECIPGCLCVQCQGCPCCGYEWCSGGNSVLMH